MEEKMGFHKTIEISFDFFDRYLQKKEKFILKEMYDEWIEKNNINEDNGWEEFESLFDAEQEETKLERIYRFILIQYMLERNILFLLDERNFREIIVFKDTCDIELYMFLRQKFNVSGERTEPMNKIQRVWISFKDEILKTIVTFYKPTDRFKR
ncbi:MAG: hypothetical protein ACRDDG_12930, partial [Cetobacterium sp.]